MANYIELTINSIRDVLRSSDTYQSTARARSRYDLRPRLRFAIDDSKESSAENSNKGMDRKGRKASELVSARYHYTARGAHVTVQHGFIMVLHELAIQTNLSPYP